MTLFTIQQRYKYYFSCCIFLPVHVRFFPVRIYPSALFSVCASFRVRFFPMRLYTYALFSGALFSGALFSSALFSRHLIQYVGNHYSPYLELLSSPSFVRYFYLFFDPIVIYISLCLPLFLFPSTMPVI